jgi:hypothetical protein
MLLGAASPCSEFFRLFQAAQRTALFAAHIGGRDRRRIPRQPHQEDAMTKTRLAVVTVILAATAMLASTAEAGMKVRLGFGYPLGSFTAHGNSSSGGGYHKKRRAKRQHVRRKTRDDVEVTKKATATKPVAKAEPEASAAPADQAATNENSSISTAATDQPVKQTSPDDGSEAAPAKNVGCKQFFPSVGMTLTVPCE